MDDLVALVREARPHIERITPTTEEWLGRLEERHEDLHALVDGRLEFAAALWPFWWLRGHMDEGRDFLERAAAIEGPDREQVLKGLGTIAFRQGDLDAAEHAFRQRFEIVEEQGSQRDVVDSLTDLARIDLRRGDFEGVRKHAERAYAAAEDLGEEEALRLPLHMCAAAARMEGKLDEARGLYLQSRELNDRLGHDVMLAAEDHNLFHVELRAGNRDEAERRFRSSNAWILGNDNAYMRPYTFLDAGVLALHDGDVERAGRLVAYAQRLFEQSGSIPDPDDGAELDEAVARLREQLGDRYEAVAAEGRALGLEEAAALATAE
jgi:hypothetical protein